MSIDRRCGPLALGLQVFPTLQIGRDIFPKTYWRQFDRRVRLLLSDAGQFW